MYATATEALEAAQKNVPSEIRRGQKVLIAIVEDQIAANSEDPARPFHYCPAASVSMLHRFGTMIATTEIAR